ncbi:hypothetical protein AAVH_41634, partial [Aphelenchoides avenae]
PVYHDVTGDQRKWIAFPNERPSEFGTETGTFVSVERYGAQGKDCRITIYGTELNVQQACAKLAQYTATCWKRAVPKHVARWMVGHNWSRAKDLETRFGVRFVKDHCESDASRSVVKIIGTAHAVNSALTDLDLKNVKPILYVGTTVLGIYLTNHKGFRQRRIEDATNTVIIFEKNADTKEGQTCCTVTGYHANTLAAVEKLKELRLVIVGVRVHLSFNLGRFVVGDPKGDHPRRQEIEEHFDVTIHLERENLGRNYPSEMIVAGREADVKNALEHLLHGGPLVEMCYELDAMFYRSLVPKTATCENNFDEINKIGSCTETQINVSNTGKYRCKCGAEERRVFEVSVAGPYKRVIEALRRIAELVPKPADGPQPVQNVLRFRRGTLANIHTENHAEFGVSSMPLATNRTVLLAPFVYPLTYWPEGTLIEMTDFISRAYLDQCQRFGARFCRNCPVHHRELGG